MSLGSRISRLERFRQPFASYVVRISKPPTKEELADLARANAERRPVAILPNKCATAKEWLASLVAEGIRR